MTQILSFDMDRDDLGARLGGGLPAGSLVVLFGRNGAGKSILAQRLTAGLVRQGASVAYVSTELTTRNFFEQMRSLDYEVRGHVLTEQLVVVPTHPMFGARAPKDELLGRLGKAEQLYTRDVVIFDAFSKLLRDSVAGRGDTQSLRQDIEAVLHLFKRLTNAGRTLILTIEDGEVTPDLVNAFLQAADILIELELEVVGSTATRRMVVKRMSRAAGRFGEVIGFRVEPGIGLVVEIRSVV